MTREMKRLLGAGFVLVVIAAVVLSVLVYRKAFTPVVSVTLEADHTGLQLSEGADVKLRGVIVGEVRRVDSDGDRARLRLALDPSAAGQIPSNVEARLLPRSLFGERYVALVLPTQPSAEPIASGAVIGQDRTETAVELERIIDEALPLLQAIRPDALAATLGALAYALDGRGARIGTDIGTADRILAELNKEMPTIAADVDRLVDVVQTYDGAADDVLAILRNATVTMDTVVDQRAQLAGFLVDATELADTTRDFLQRHGESIIRLGQVTRPVLELLAAYSPEYPCLLAGAAALEGPAREVFAGGTMHITLEITRDQGRYVPGRDEPVYAAQDGPDCRGLPSPTVPFPDTHVADGYGGGGAFAAPAAMGYAGSVEERELVKPLIAAATGTRVDRVPDVAVLLWGPLLRGSVVSLT